MKTNHTKDKHMTPEKTVQEWEKEFEEKTPLVFMGREWAKQFIKNLLTAHAQELQKAREEERKKTLKKLKEIIDIGINEATNTRVYLYEWEDELKAISPTPSVDKEINPQ